jgi:hypothetical protein
MLHRMTTGSRILSVALLSISALAPLSVSAQQAPGKRSTSKPERKNTKLTVRQKHGLRMLEAAEAESAALEPEMRAFVLWQVALGYQKLDRARYLQLLQSAFQVASAIEPSQSCDKRDYRCDAQGWLQDQIGRQIVASNPAAGEEILSQADREARAGLTADLISQYTNPKDFDRALELLRRSYDEGYFFLGGANGLIRALPANRSADRLEVFNLALSYVQQQTGPSQGLLNFFGTMVARFWNQVPPSAVLEAMDELLERAKEADEKGQSFRMTAATKRGTLEVTSRYEFQLFEMLPVLKQLDPSRAESLLRENPALQAKLEKYPAGLLSILPNDMPLEGEKTVGTLWVSTSHGANTAETAREQARAIIAHQQGQAVDLATKDPKSALNAVLALPLWGVEGPGKESPRASALLDITSYKAIADAGLVSKALTEALKIADEMEPLYAGRIVANSAELAASYKDTDTVQLAINKGIKIAEKLYARDSDASDPNVAMKAQWPSMGLWRRLAEVEARFAPDACAELINSVPDAEIRALQRVACASALLGIGTGYVEAYSVHKDGNEQLWSY